MVRRLLETKFHTPRWRTGYISRPALRETLQAGYLEGRKLTLVSAPAGYGKTTLVAEWVHSLMDDANTVWLSLEETENQLARFLGYWLAALRRAAGTLDGDVLDFSDQQPMPPLPLILDNVLNELAGQENAILLVLDDYHLISNSAVHAALDYFIAHQPAQIHLVIVTRTDPPLSLARLRARRQMTEIRAQQLRFTLDETRAFFERALNLELDADNVRTLEARTEGWVTGLQLAALALGNLPNPSDFIETFRGSHRYVLDYLAEEVVRQQGEHLQRFLTQISTLDRFNAPLCQAVTSYGDCQDVLDRLEQANMFVIALDHERNWYRFHRLFADYLRTEVAPDQRATICRRAAHWHETQGLTFEAVRYALACGDGEFAAEVVERALAADDTWSGGHISVFESWLEALPSQAFERRPQLCLDASRVLYTAGRFELAENYIALAEDFIRSQPSTPERGQMLALASLYRGSIASVRGETQPAIEHIRAALGDLGPQDHLAHAHAHFSLAQAYQFEGRTEQAVQHYLRSSQEAQTAGVLFPAIHATCTAARLQISQGHLSLAEQTCQAAIHLAGGQRTSSLGLAHSLLGSIALERNDLEAAAGFLGEGLALSRWGNRMDDMIWGLIYQSRLHAAQGTPPEALKAMLEAYSLIQAYGVERIAVLGAAYLARIQHQIGDQQAARQWAAKYLTQRDEHDSEYADLTLARVWLGSGELGKVPDILDPLLADARDAGRLRVCIESMILLARFHQAGQDTAAALDWLSQALQMAAPGGFVRLFLDEGQALLDLLPQVRPAAPQLVDEILGGRPGEGEPGSSPLAALPEALSEAEVRVFELVMAGKSNREIADELFISVGTAKWHVHNILSKLGVRNRAQAIALARELGL